MDKHASLSGLFVSYEENEVLWIWTLYNKLFTTVINFVQK